MYFYSSHIAKRHVLIFPFSRSLSLQSLENKSQGHFGNSNQEIYQRKKNCIHCAYALQNKRIFGNIVVIIIIVIILIAIIIIMKSSRHCHHHHHAVATAIVIVVVCALLIRAVDVYGSCEEDVFCSVLWKIERYFMRFLKWMPVIMCVLGCVCVSAHTICNAIFVVRIFEWLAEEPNKTANQTNPRRAHFRFEKILVFGSVSSQSQPRTTCTSKMGCSRNTAVLRLFFNNTILARRRALSVCMATRWVVDWLQCRWVVVNGIM